MQNIKAPIFPYISCFFSTCNEYEYLRIILTNKYIICCNFTAMSIINVYRSNIIIVTAPPPPLSFS